jgi:hypothetical protein
MIEDNRSKDLPRRNTDFFNSIDPEPPFAAVRQPLETL